MRAVSVNVRTFCKVNGLFYQNMIKVKFLGNSFIYIFMYLFILLNQTSVGVLAMTTQTKLAET